MNYRYSVVIFKNKVKKKILKNYNNFNSAEKYFDGLISNNSVIFEKKLENGLDVSFDLLIIGPPSEGQPFFIKDDNQRNVKIFSENKDFSILKISKFSFEEDIYDFFNKRKINFIELESLIKSKKGINLLSKINNKLVLQSDEEILIFSTKCISDCERLLDVIEEKKFINLIIVRDTSSVQKKYIYNILSEKGIKKSYLYRQSTTHLK